MRQSLSVTAVENRGGSSSSATTVGWFSPMGPTQQQSGLERRQLQTDVCTICTRLRMAELEWPRGPVPPSFRGHRYVLPLHYLTPSATPED